MSRGSRTADIGQIDRTQVGAVDDVVVDVDGVAGGIVIGFHIFDAVDVAFGLPSQGNSDQACA